LDSPALKSGPAHDHTVVYIGMCMSISHTPESVLSGHPALLPRFRSIRSGATSKRLRWANPPAHPERWTAHTLQRSARVAVSCVAPAPDLHVPNAVRCRLALVVRSWGTIGTPKLAQPAPPSPCRLQPVSRRPSLSRLAVLSVDAELLESVVLVLIGSQGGFKTASFAGDDPRASVEL